MKVRSLCIEGGLIQTKWWGYSEIVISHGIALKYQTSKKESVPVVNLWKEWRR